MTDRRPYRTAISWDEALEELAAGAGTQFDPDVIDGVVACEPDLRAIAKQRLAAACRRPVHGEPLALRTAKGCACPVGRRRGSS